jgi:hypothetical protein
MIFSENGSTVIKGKIKECLEDYICITLSLLRDIPEERIRQAFELTVKHKDIEPDKRIDFLKERQGRQ